MSTLSSECLKTPSAQIHIYNSSSDDVRAHMPQTQPMGREMEIMEEECGYARHVCVGKRVFLSARATLTKLNAEIRFHTLFLGERKIIARKRWSAAQLGLPPDRDFFAKFYTRENQRYSCEIEVSASEITEYDFTNFGNSREKLERYWRVWTISGIASEFFISFNPLSNWLSNSLLFYIFCVLKIQTSFMVGGSVWHF